MVKRWKAVEHLATAWAEITSHETKDSKAKLRRAQEALLKTDTVEQLVLTAETLRQAEAGKREKREADRAAAKAQKEAEKEAALRRKEEEKQQKEAEKEKREAEKEAEK